MSIVAVPAATVSIASLPTSVRTDRDRGSIMVESLLVLPLYFVLVFFIAEAVIVGYDFMAVQFIASQAVRDAVVLKPGDAAPTRNCDDGGGNDECESGHDHCDDNHTHVTRHNLKMKRYRKIQARVDDLARGYHQPTLTKRICAGQPFVLGTKIASSTGCLSANAGAPGELVYVEVKRNVRVMFQLLSFEVSGTAIGRNEQNVIPDPL